MCCPSVLMSTGRLSDLLPSTSDSNSISEEVLILRAFIYSIFNLLFSIDYINCLSETTDKNWHKSDRIFVTNTGKPVHSSILSKSLQRANERLKKPIPKHLSPHIFRHTTISILSENKIPLKTITDRVGHSDSEVTTSIYTHVTKNMKDEAINVLDKVMKKIF